GRGRNPRQVGKRGVAETAGDAGGPSASGLDQAAPVALGGEEPVKAEWSVGHLRPLRPPLRQGRGNGSRGGSRAGAVQPRRASRAASPAGNRSAPPRVAAAPGSGGRRGRRRSPG